MGKWSFPSYSVERGEHPTPGEHLSSHWGEGAIGMELQGSGEQNFGQQGKPRAKEESRDARRQRGFGRERRGDGGREQHVRMQGQEPVRQQARLCGAHAWSTVTWRET